MKRLLAWIWMLAALAILGGCADQGGGDGTPEAGAAGLNQPFDLTYGGSTRVDEAGLTVRFLDVTEDSRCPTDVNCVWAGQATMLFEVDRDDSGAQQVTVTISGGASDPVQVGDYSLNVTALNPYPRSDVDIEKDDYIATLTISQ